MIQTFECLGCGTKIRNKEDQSSELPEDIDAQENEKIGGHYRRRLWLEIQICKGLSGRKQGWLHVIFMGKSI